MQTIKQQICLCSYTASAGAKRQRDIGPAARGQLVVDALHGGPGLPAPGRSGGAPRIPCLPVRPAVH